MFKKFELIGAGASVFFMALALYLVQVETTLFSGVAEEMQAAQLLQTQQPGVIAVGEGQNSAQARAAAIRAAADASGNLNNMVIDDVKIGSGEPVQEGDIVSVHYIGTLQNGQEFDNSRKRGQPFEFKVGGGQVITGWEKGLLGMKVGGQRMLIVPPEMAYGEQGIGPIPGNATLVFAIELMEVK